jgi:hypothetical protein
MANIMPEKWYFRKCMKLNNYQRLNDRDSSRNTVERPNSGSAKDPFSN